MRALGVVADAICAQADETADGAREAANATAERAISLAADIAFEAAELDRTRRLPDLKEKVEAEVVRMIAAAPPRWWIRFASFAVKTAGLPSCSKKSIGGMVG